MSDKVQIEVDESDFVKIMETLGTMKKKAPVILKNAINRTATNAKTNMAKGATKKYRVKQKQVNESISIKKATNSNLSAKVKSKGFVVDLIDFRVSPNHPVRYIGKEKKKRPSPKVYKAATEKGSQLKPLIGTIKPFVQKMETGHIGVFARVLNGTKIKQLYGPSIPQMIKREEVIADIEQKANEMLAKRIQHEINRILEGGS
ncbi:MAG: phage tail protein [Velocimicrobium sp.]